jgi:Anti-sigma-K factor rskA
MTDPEPAHVADELPGLLAGECDREQTFTLAAHLRACLECQEELVSVVVATGILRATARAEQAPSPAVSPSRALSPSSPFSPSRAVSPSSLPSSSESTSSPGAGAPDTPEWLTRATRRGPAGWSIRRRFVALAAAVVIVAGAVAAGLGLSTSSAPVTNRAALRALQAPAGAHGAVTVTGASGARQVQVSTDGLPAPGQGHYYEVWLLDPATLKMLPMGALAPSGQATFGVATGLMAGYSAIDVSLQANNGNPVHSAVSVLRGTLRSS